MQEWLRLIPEGERKTYESSGLGAREEIGARPALIVIDVTYGFTGEKGRSLEEAIAEYSTACGPIAWEAMPRIRDLIEIFRSAGRPIVFTRSAPANTPYSGRATKSAKVDAAISVRENEIPAEIAPRAAEWVLEKTKASAFFQTPLSTYLTREQADSVIICGVSTSGCVRASAVDCFSHGFKTFIVDECCFDRSHFSHCVTLFDLNAKYATVISLAEVQDALSKEKS